MMTSKIKIFAALLPGFLTVFALSCRREPLQENLGPGGLSFAVSETIPDLQTKAEAACARIQAGDVTIAVSEEILPVCSHQTKASAVYTSTDATALNGAPIAVWAYNMAAADINTPASWKVDGGSTSPVRASYDSHSGKWKTTVPYNSSARNENWQTRWCAVAPWAAVEGGDAVSVISDNTAPSLTYTVPAASAGQHDLMTLSAPTTARGVADENDVALSFIHALTGIKFAADDGVTLTAATLSGVFDKATLDLMTGEWSGHQKSITTPSFSASGFGTDEAVLMMIPQWLPAGAKLTLTVDGSTVEVDLSGHKWIKGRMVTYRVSASSEFHIEVTMMDEVAASGTSTQVARVRSYSAPKGNPAGMKPAQWKIAGVYATLAAAHTGGGSSLPGWTVTASSTEGYSGGAEEIIFVTSTPVSASGTVNQLLAAAPAWGTADAPWNLANRISGEDYIKESANTYIINAPGYYRIPLVVGNAVKEDWPNTAAYPSSNFVDYKGQSIGSPYLHQTSTSAGTPTSGAVVWTENSGMVQNLTVEKDASQVYWLKFNIETAQQGCTVVSVQDENGTVMWSWLLWVTDYEPGKGDVSATNAAFMPRNLGWSVTGNVSYTQAPGVAFVRLEPQDDPSEYFVVRVRRGAGAPSVIPNAGHGPFFQWGRKDAMPPTAAEWSSATSGNKKPEDLIQNPGLHFPNTLYPYVAAPTGGGLTEFNYWSATATDVGQDIATVKTVYDPCPAGYTVPRLNAFNNLSGSSWISGSGYAGRSFIGGALYLPAAGYRGQAPSNGDLVDSNIKGRYWVAVAQGGTGNAARRLEVSSSGLNLPSGGGNNQKPMEFSIRPTREE